MSDQFSNCGPSCHSALRNSVSFEAVSVQGASNSDLNSDGEAVRGTEGSLCHFKVMVMDIDMTANQTLSTKGKK